MPAHHFQYSYICQLNIHHMWRMNYAFSYIHSRNELINIYKNEKYKKFMIMNIELLFETLS